MGSGAWSRLAKAGVAFVAGASMGAAASGIAAGANSVGPPPVGVAVSMNLQVKPHPIRAHRAETLVAAGLQRRAALPSGNSVVGGAWTSLGPAPIADEKSCCNPT